MDGKRLMARNVYQVFRCFRSTIHFFSILETHRLAWQGWFGLVENSWPNKSSGRNNGTESKRLATPLSIEFENRNNLRFVRSTILLLCFCTLFCHGNYRRPSFAIFFLFFSLFYSSLYLLEG